MLRITRKAKQNILKIILRHQTYKEIVNKLLIQYTRKEGNPER